MPYIRIPKQFVHSIKCCYQERLKNTTPSLRSSCCDFCWLKQGSTGPIRCIIASLLFFDKWLAHFYINPGAETSVSEEVALKMRYSTWCDNAVIAPGLLFRFLFFRYRTTHLTVKLNILSVKIHHNAGSFKHILSFFNTWITR